MVSILWYLWNGSSGPSTVVRSSMVLPEGERLASGGLDDARFVLHRHAIAVSPDGRWVAFLSYLQDQGAGHPFGREVRLRLLNLWQGNARQAPTAVRPFMTRDLVRWKDHAVWNDQENRVEWRFEAFHLDRLFDARGANAFSAVDDGSTRVDISGTLEVYPERVPGVPRLVARRIAPRVESFVIGLITPNLAQLPRAVQEYLDQEDKGVDP